MSRYCDKKESSLLYLFVYLVRCCDKHQFRIHSDCHDAVCPSLLCPDTGKVHFAYVHSAKGPHSETSIVGGLPSRGYTAKLTSHFGVVHRCRFWFNMYKTHSLPSSDDNASYVYTAFYHHTKWVYSPGSRLTLRPFNILLTWTLWRWRFWSTLPRARRGLEQQDLGNCDSRVWRAT